ncbi:hypothetical protein [Bacillus wiedmannii]
MENAYKRSIEKIIKEKEKQEIHEKISALSLVVKATPYLDYRV